MIALECIENVWNIESVTVLLLMKIKVIILH